jgi:hypothetical protein
VQLDRRNDPSDRRNHERRDRDQSCPRTVEQLIRDTQIVLGNCGVAMPPSKVSRLVRTYKHNVEGNGFSFAEFIVNNIAIHAEQREVIVAELVKVISYADITGETATRNLDRAGAANVMRARQSAREVRDV